MLQGASSLLLLHGAGAVIGPSVAGVLMEWLGAAALLLHFAVVFAALAGYAAWRLWISPEGPSANAVFVPMVRTTPAALEMISPPETETAAANPATEPRSPAALRERRRTETPDSRCRRPTIRSQPSPMPIHHFDRPAVEKGVAAST